MKRLSVVIAWLALGLIHPPSISTAIWTYSDCGGFKSYQERLEFHRIARKHFHPRTKHHVTVIDWPKNPHYFDEKGRRCAFK
jgi:hypothetical protein